MKPLQFFKILRDIHSESGQSPEVLVRYDGWDSEAEDDNSHIVVVETYELMESEDENDVHHFEIIKCQSQEMALAIVESFSKDAASDWVDKIFSNP